MCLPHFRLPLLYAVCLYNIMRLTCKYKAKWKYKGVAQKHGDMGLILHYNLYIF